MANMAVNFGTLIFLRSPIVRHIENGTWRNKFRTQKKLIFGNAKKKNINAE